MDPAEKKRRVGPSLEDLQRASEPKGDKLVNEAREWEELRQQQQQQQQQQQRKREEWMTKLPEGSRQDALQFFRGGKTSFSAKGAAGSEV